MENDVKKQILVVDDEESVLNSFALILDENYIVHKARTGEDALDIIKKENIFLVFLDITLPGIDGFEVLKRIRKYDEDIDVVMVTANNMIKTAVSAIKKGAFDYIPKPFDVDEILLVIEKALKLRESGQQLSYFKSEVEKSFDPFIFVGESRAVKDIFELIAKVCMTDSTILISGESGTGKELVARIIHRKGPSKDKPFIAVNCGAIPRELLESELFGHERGSFTGAIQKKIGKFELANGGTIFLDEISNMSLEMQAKLLRTLEEREIERVGGAKTIKINLRVISATNVDMKSAVKKGTFREDLYYRLNVININLPPLRERKEDIPLLLRHFLKVYSTRFGKPIKTFSPEAMQMLINYSWPGNIREVRNIMERMVVLLEKDVIEVGDVPLDISFSEIATSFRADSTLLKENRDSFEKQFIIRVLQKVDWNQTRAAEMLGIHRNTLLMKMNSLGIKEEKEELKPNRTKEGSN